MLIEQEISGDIEQLTRLFKNSPQKTEKAIQRALAKVSRWAERQVLRDLSRQMNVTQKQLKALNRVVVRRTKTPGEKRYLSVWIGTNPVGAHRFGTPRQTRDGVRVGKRFWRGAFLLQPHNTDKTLVFRRKANWQHRYQQSRRSGRWMWMGLPLEKQTVPIEAQADASLQKLSPVLLDRFTDLLHQELNYAFNVES